MIRFPDSPKQTLRTSSISNTRRNCRCLLARSESTGDLWLIHWPSWPSALLFHLLRYMDGHFGKSYQGRLAANCLLHILFFIRTPFFSAQAGKETEIATNKLTTMFLKYRHFEPKCSYKKCSYRKKNVYYVHDCSTKLSPFAANNFFSALAKFIASISVSAYSRRVSEVKRLHRSFSRRNYVKQSHKGYMVNGTRCPISVFCTVCILKLMGKRLRRGW